MSADLEVASRHAGARYLGMPLFLLGAVGLAASLWAWLAAGGTGGGVMLYMGATGLSLGVFGVHNDTAVAHMVRAGAGALPEGMAAEVREELIRDRAAAMELAPTPGIAWGITAVALLFHAWAAYRLSQVI